MSEPETPLLARIIRLEAALRASEAALAEEKRSADSMRVRLGKALNERNELRDALAEEHEQVDRWKVAHDEMVLRHKSSEAALAASETTVKQIQTQFESAMALYNDAHLEHVVAANALAKAQAESKAAGNLLAVIHRDGGHYISEHGWKKACEDAEAIAVGNLVALEAVATMTKERDGWKEIADGWKLVADERELSRAEATKAEISATFGLASHSAHCPLTHPETGAQIKCLYCRLTNLGRAVERFQKRRGRHDGPHSEITPPTFSGPTIAACALCELSYMEAEAELDTAIRAPQPPEHRDNLEEASGMVGYPPSSPPPPSEEPR